MTLTEEDVLDRLAPRDVRFYRQIDSTNDEALAWLRAGAPSGAVVVADEQLKGRGRLGRTWHTPPGVALAVSVILRLSADHLHQVTMLGALAVYDVAEHLTPPPDSLPVPKGFPSVIHGEEEKSGLAMAANSELLIGIKWPNDVQVRGRKVCGILPEAAWDGARLEGVVLGMGLNVRVDFAGTELAETAISLETALGRQLNRVDVLAYLLERVDYWATLLGTSELFQAWKSRLTTLGRDVTINGLRGVAEDVDESGALLLRDAAGELQRVIAGDIVLGDGSG